MDAIKGRMIVLLVRKLEEATFMFNWGLEISKRKEIESRTGKPIVSSQNAKMLRKQQELEWF